MAIGWSKPRYSPIAIDFGADSLKMLQIIQGHDRNHIASDPPKLVAAACAELPDSARKDPAARNAFYSEALKELLASQPFKGRRAICAIPAYQTLIQHLQVTRVDREDYDTQVGMHLRQRLNVDPTRMVIRNYPIANVQREGNKQEVICMAASREAVMRHIEMAHRAKLDVVGMECEPQAILKSFAYLFRRDADMERVTCFIDLGAATTKVVISHGAEMVFAKLVHAAGDHLTRRLAAIEGLSFGDARRQRIASLAPGAAETQGSESEGDKVAITGQERRGSKPVEGVGEVVETKMAASVGGEGTAVGQATQVTTAERPQRGTAVAPRSAYNETLDCLVDELQMCSRYYQSIFPERAIEKVIFLGGESRYGENCQAIARSLRIAAQLGDPMARVVKISKSQPTTGVDMQQPQPGWAVPMGLCLSEPNL